MSPPWSAARPVRVLVAATGLAALTACSGGGTAAPAGTAPSVTAPSLPSSTAPVRPSGTPSSTPSGPEVTEVEVRIAGGRVESATDRVSVPRGATVAFVVTSDEADEAHLHGYDVEVPLEPGEPARLEVVADVSGVFELETHDSGLLLLQLEVA